MNKTIAILVINILCVLPTLAETNAHLEVKLFKTWVIPNEVTFGNLAIKNTGTDFIRLAKDAIQFEISQLDTHLVGNTFSKKQDPVRDTDFKMYVLDDPNSLALPPGETHVYEGRKFLLYIPTSGEEFVMSIYQGNGFWLDSEPLTAKGIIPDSVEELTTVKDNTRNLHLEPRKMTAVTYKNERWLYYANVYPICPLSLDGKIRIEPHDGAGLFKIWDGDKSMIYRDGQNIILEGPDEHNVLGKWTRERKQKAEADNAEVRRKKAEEQK